MWLNSLRSTNEVSWSHAERLITNQLYEIYADVAQLAEQLICNQQVIGSSPIIGSTSGRGVYKFISDACCGYTGISTIRTFSSVG